MMVGRLHSFWNGLFARPMLNFQGVTLSCWKENHPLFSQRYCSWFRTQSFPWGQRLRQNHTHDLEKDPVILAEVNVTWVFWMKVVSWMVSLDFLDWGKSQTYTMKMNIFFNVHTAKTYIYDLSLFLKREREKERNSKLIELILNLNLHMLYDKTPLKNPQVQANFHVFFSRFRISGTRLSCDQGQIEDMLTFLDPSCTTHCTQHTSAYPTGI